MARASWWRRAGGALLDWMYPPRCVICSAADGWLCRDCEAKIEFVPPPPNAPDAQLLGAPLLVMDQFYAYRAVAYHRGVMRPAIHKLKYEGVRVLAPILGDMMYAYWNTCPIPTDLIIPVPLHPRRLRQRGYNQSELLAQALAERMGVPLDRNALARQRYTSPQVGLDMRERSHNVLGAFLAEAERVGGKRVLLVDDVCTTGATLAACSAALRRADVSSVSAFALARATSKQPDW